MARIHVWLPILLVCFASALAFPMPAAATLVERALMPGEVISAHAKWEDDCKSCHVSFDREGQTALCVACHKEIGADVKARSGMHGRLPNPACNECHTDHEGRNARIVVFEPKGFRHDKVDFLLDGKHAGLDCDQCHKPALKYREAPSTCFGCHAKDDRHEGSFGKDCAECHETTDWTTVSFDHQRTGFVLRAKHAEARCDACHVKAATEVKLDDACVSCHAKDDVHHGSLGKDCAQCHEDLDWKRTRFDHSSTGFALQGRHARAQCEACHKTAGNYKGLEQACYSCHRVDDKHEGTLGKACADCHDAAAWKPAPRFNHARTRFALDGKHRAAQCLACHAKPTAFRDTQRECIDCHRDDDSHKGRNGDACADCHGSSDWKQSRFDHDRDTPFALRGGHRQVKCEDCHKGGVEREREPRTCLECHRDDSPHKESLGDKCEDCHGEDKWTTTTFDHAKSRFPLLGAHRAAKCADCHRDKDYRATEDQCIACHKDDDAHETRLGPDCGNCHNARDWALWDFDHARRTRYALEGAHARVACTDCHVRQNVKDLKISDDCGSCHAADDPHEGEFGSQCGRCHKVSSFRDLISTAR